MAKHHCDCGAVLTVPGNTPAAQATLAALVRTHQIACPKRGGETK